VNSKTGLSRKVATVPSNVLALAPSNFDAVIADPTKHKLVEFYAPVHREAGGGCRAKRGEGRAMVGGWREGAKEAAQRALLTRFPGLSALNA
jgi:hypothetical protein